MARYSPAGAQGTVKDGMGRIIAGATVSVYLSGNNQTIPANVFTGPSGGSLVNSVISSNTGYYQFFVDDTVYSATQTFDIVVSMQGYQTQIFTYMSLYSNQVTNTNFGTTGFSLTGPDGHTWQITVDTLADGGRLINTQTS